MATARGVQTRALYRFFGETTHHLSNSSLSISKPSWGVSTTLWQPGFNPHSQSSKIQSCEWPPKASSKSSHSCSSSTTTSCFCSSRGPARRGGGHPHHPAHPPRRPPCLPDQAPAAEPHLPTSLASTRGRAPPATCLHSTSSDGSLNTFTTGTKKKTPTPTREETTTTTTSSTARETSLLQQRFPAN